MRKALHIYVYGHLHISLCAVLLFVGGYHLVGQQPDLSSCLFVFTSTLLVYTLHRHLAANKFYSITSIKRYTFVNNHSRLSWMAIAICTIISIFTFFLLQRSSQYAMIICGLLSLGYVLPLIAKSRIRDIGILKIFAISIVWGVLPFLGYLEVEGLSIRSIILLIEHFAFVFALTIPFDIRDSDLDDGAQVSNLANQIGLSVSKMWMVLLVLLALALAIVSFVLGTYSLVLMLAHVLFYAVVLYSCYQADEREELYFMLYLDGLILVKGIILVIGS